MVTGLVVEVTVAGLYPRTMVFTSWYDPIVAAHSAASVARAIVNPYREWWLICKDSITSCTKCLRRVTIDSFVALVLVMLLSLLLSWLLVVVVLVLLLVVVLVLLLLLTAVVDDDLVK